MRTCILFLCCFILGLSWSTSAEAVKGIPASVEGIQALGQALRGGIIQIGKTRLHEIREVYGDPADITEDEQRIAYDYGELRIEFIKREKWRYWEYDSFRKPVYTDDVDDLRFDLESNEIVGENITFRKIRRDYGEPTESFSTDEDGQLSIYYYGDIKVVFENVFLVRSWRGSLALPAGSGGSEGILGSGLQSDQSEQR